MNTKIITTIICIIFMITFFCGCQEEIPPINNDNQTQNGNDNTTQNNTENPPTNGSIIFVDDDGGQNYTNIRSAIRNSKPGDTIFVYSGMYYETFQLDKTLILLGENKVSTIIQYNGTKNDDTDVVFITADSCKVNGFTIQTTENSTGVMGIKVESSDNILSNNTLTYFNHGIYVKETNNNVISNNYISNSNDYAIKIQGSDSNTVTGNSINENKKGALFCCGSVSNLIYNNNFENNIELNAYDLFHNDWDNGEIGNYWSNYQGEDLNGDGIGDTPYNLSSGDSQDRFPLMAPTKK